MSVAHPEQQSELTAQTLDARAGEAPQIALFVAVALLVYLLIRNGSEALVGDLPQLVPIWHGLIVLAAVPAVRVRYDPAIDFATHFARGSAIFMTVYFLSEPFTVPAAGLPADHIAIAFQGYARWLGLALAVGAWFRPAAGFAAAMTLWLARDLNGPITGFPFSVLDIRNVIEVIAFVFLGMCLVFSASQWPRVKATLGLTPHIAGRALLLILAIGIGGHLGNYFYSSIAKLALDGGPLSWVFGNHLYDAIPGALEKGSFPFAASPFLTQLVYDTIRVLNTPLHLFGFVAQFAAIIAIWRRKWVMALTVVYDLFHVSVYLTYGLLFWKWIALNAIFLATLASISDAQWTRSVRVVLMATLIGGAIFFKTATLAWYDSPGFMSPFFEAETSEGERLRVPSAYFGSASYQASHGRFYAPASNEHFNFSIWGSVLKQKDLQAGRDCVPPRRETMSPEMFGPPERVARYVWAQHDRAIAKGGSDGKYNYNAYLHHHFPAPFVARPFDDLDKRDITAYRLVLESVCLTLENGQLKRDVVARTEIPLPRPQEPLEAK